MEGCSTQQASAGGERKGDKKIGKIRKVEGAAAAFRAMPSDLPRDAHRPFRR
jgi:hypothetical protein